MSSRFSICLAVLLFVPSLAHADIVFFVDLNMDQVGIQQSMVGNADDVLTATIVLQLTDAATSLSSYGITLEYDPNELSFLLSGSVETPPTGLQSLVTLKDSAVVGTISGIEAGTFDSGPAGPAIFNIATIHFRVLTPLGNAQDIDLRLFEAPPFDGLFDNEGKQLVPSFFGASVVTSVPEPLPLPLVGLSLMALILYRGSLRRQSALGLAKQCGA
ncbi:MAG: hypothetical protein IT422_14695 [Pirellulaceae bacterium]|nr:hypothetical protein [Pirellulaceae bacterium]